MFIQCGQAANDIRYSELYLRLVMVFKLAMLIFATFYSLRSQSSLIASTLVISWIVLTINFLWALYPDSDMYLVQPCTIPFINMLKLAIYLTSFWAAAIAMATTVAFPEATQEAKFQLVLAGLIIVGVIRREQASEFLYEISLKFHSKVDGKDTYSTFRVYTRV